MGVNAMEIRVHIQKVLIFTIKTCYRSACEHPIVLGMLLFLLFLYRFLPFLFFFLVSSSPVIICTAVLLGTLLSLGNPYIPEIIDEEDEQIRKTHHEISSLRNR
ncbi:cardiomyopathy-associated protein, partial [Thalictrum thalictroides]